MTTHPLQRSAFRPHQRHQARKWIKRIALMAAAAVGLGIIVYAWLPSPVRVDTATARRTTLEVEVSEDGRTRVRDRFVVSAPASGNLERIELDAGDAVERGVIVATIAPPDPTLLDERTRHELAARLAAAIARERRADEAVARARAARELAEREATRGRTLAEQGAITGTERDRLDLDAQLAARELAAMEAERAGAGADAAAIRATLGADGKPVRRAPVVVTAPAAGRVLRVVRDSAGPIATGTPLLEIGDPAAIEIIVDVLSSDAARIRPGMEAEIDGWGGDRLHGHVCRVEPSAFTRISALGVEEQRVNVIVTVDRPPPTLGDGFRVDARIVLWRGDVLAIPASAVFRDHDRWSVYVVEDGRVRLRPIAIGRRGRLAVEVTSGLPEGAVVVLHPTDRVTDGARVEPR